VVRQDYARDLAVRRQRDLERDEHIVEGKEATMRVLVIVKASKESEAGQMPSEKLLTEMGKFNEELVKAGVMLAADGLHPSSKGKRVSRSSRSREHRDHAVAWG